MVSLAQRSTRLRATELATELDSWLYFLRNAEKIDTEALPAGLAQHPPVRRAVEELKMLNQTDLERERYEARRKFQLDYNTGMKVARLEGEESGHEKARREALISNINFCEQFLRRAATPAEQLAHFTAEDLTRLAEQLQAEVLKQRS